MCVQPPPPLSPRPNPHTSVLQSPDPKFPFPYPQVLRPLFPVPSAPKPNPPSFVPPNLPVPLSPQIPQLLSPKPQPLSPTPPSLTHQSPVPKHPKADPKFPILYPQPLQAHISTPNQTQPYPQTSVLPPPEPHSHPLSPTPPALIPNPFRPCPPISPDCPLSPPRPRPPSLQAPIPTPTGLVPPPNPRPGPADPDEVHAVHAEAGHDGHQLFLGQELRLGRLHVYGPGPAPRTELGSEWGTGTGTGPATRPRSLLAARRRSPAHSTPLPAAGPVFALSAWGRDSAQLIGCSIRTWTSIGYHEGRAVALSVGPIPMPPGAPTNQSSALVVGAPRGPMRPTPTCVRGARSCCPLAARRSSAPRSSLPIGRGAEVRPSVRPPPGCL